MAKQITITLNGKEQTLEFGKFYFQKFYHEVTGKDPLGTTISDWSLGDQFDFVVALVFAGLKTQYKVEGKPFDFTKEDIQDWVGVKDDKEIADLIIEYANLNGGKQQGEEERQMNGAEKTLVGEN